MSVFDLIQDKDLSVPGDSGPLDFQYATFDDVAKTTFQDVFYNRSPIGSAVLLRPELKNRAKLFESLTGENILDSFVNSFESDEERQVANRLANRIPDPKKPWDDAGQDEELTRKMDTFIQNLRAQNPGTFDAILTDSEIREKIRAEGKAISDEASETVRGASRLGAFAGTILGGGAASFLDPINLVTLPLGASAAAGIVKTALITAGINAGVEIIEHPMIKKWQNEIGNEYGLSDLAMNAGLSALVGAAIGGGGKAVAKLLGGGKVDFNVKAVNEYLDSLPEDARTSTAIYRVAIALENEDPDMSDALKIHARRLHVEVENRPKIDFDLHEKYLRETNEAALRGDVPPEIPLKAEDLPEGSAKRLLTEEIEPTILKPRNDLDEAVVRGYQEEAPINPSEDWGAVYKKQIEHFDDEAARAKVDLEAKTVLDRFTDDDVIFSVDDADGTRRVTKKQFIEAFDDEEKALKAFNFCAFGGNA